MFFYLTSKSLFVGVETTLFVNINGSWCFVTEWWNFRQGWRPIGCMEDLGFYLEGSREIWRSFPIIVASYYIINGGGGYSYVLSPG